MAEIGVFFSSEERSAAEIVAGAVKAERAGFRSAWLSDHFHPWIDAQGESPFVQIAASVPCGPNPSEHIAAIQKIVDAGFDEVHVGHIGRTTTASSTSTREILPHFEAMPASS